jgi:hypothetical protein
VNAVSVLKKIKLRGYANVTKLVDCFILNVIESSWFFTISPPDWLDTAIELLSMNDYGKYISSTIFVHFFILDGG